MTGRQIRYVRPPLYPKQSDAFFNDARYAITEASTKSGKTHGGIAWIFEQALLTGKAGRNYWWVAPVYPQAEIAYRRLRDAIPPNLRRPNESKLTITLPLGQVLWFKSGEKPDNLYGEDVYAAVIDEATRLREEAWFAVRSTLTKTEGPVRLIGNVKGRKNWAYRLARKAEAGEPGMHYAKITAHDAVQAGILSAAEVEDARQILPEDVFRELFLAEPSDDAGNPFGLDHIHACAVPGLHAGVSVCAGVDLAKSVDWTAVLGLDREGRTCAFDRFQLPWKETIARIHQGVGRARTLVDSTGVGDPVLEELQRGGHSAQYEGYKFTSESKQKLMEGLAVGLQGRRLSYPDGPIRSELEAYEYEYTRTGVLYSVPSGMHDDCVVALALAWHLLRSEGAPRPAPVVVRAKHLPQHRYGRSRY